MYCEICGAESYGAQMCWQCGNPTAAPTDQEGKRYYGGAKPPEPPPAPESGDPPSDSPQSP
jgi:hypothetical protein